MWTVAAVKMACNTERRYEGVRWDTVEVGYSGGGIQWRWDIVEVGYSGGGI